MNTNKNNDLRLNKINSKRNQVVIIKSYYPIEKDTRLSKIIRILKSKGYFITYLGWDKNYSSFFSYSIEEKEECKSIILKMKAPFGFGSFFFLPLWWLFVLIWLVKLNWDIAHVINFPSLIPAIISAKLKNKLIVYDVEDTYIDQLIILPFFRFFGIFMERFLMKFADAVILIDEMQNEEFGSIPNKNIVVIYDSPYDINRPSLNSVKKSLGKKDFKIFYAGNLNKKRNLHIESLLEAIEDIEDVEVTIVGEGDLVETIQIKAHEMPNKIHYMKWMSYIQVLEMSCQADLLFSLRDPYPLVQKYICGSKFLESLMCGKPILVNKSTSTAFKVVKNKCGIVVDANNVEEIKKAILKLKNNEEFYKSLKLNARKTYDQQYSWKIMENRLLILYNNLLKINKVERYLSF